MTTYERGTQNAIKRSRKSPVFRFMPRLQVDNNSKHSTVAIRIFRNTQYFGLNYLDQSWLFSSWKKKSRTQPTNQKAIPLPRDVKSTLTIYVFYTNTKRHVENFSSAFGTKLDVLFGIKKKTLDAIYKLVASTFRWQRSFKWF